MTKNLKMTQNLCNGTQLSTHTPDFSLKIFFSGRSRINKNRKRNFLSPAHVSRIKLSGKKNGIFFSPSQQPQKPAR